MTHQITAWIKKELLSQLKQENSNGIETNSLINDAIEMYLDALDAVRSATRHEEVAKHIYDIFLSRWKMRIENSLINQ